VAAISLEYLAALDWNPHLGLGKTCQKLRIAFWDYLGARLGVPTCPEVPYLPDLVRCRGRPA
jgi:hypothetical protein